MRYLKKVGDEVITQLVKLFKDIITITCIPQSLKEATIILLHKKGDNAVAQ